MQGVTISQIVILRITKPTAGASVKSLGRQLPAELGYSFISQTLGKVTIVYQHFQTESKLIMG